MSKSDRHEPQIYQLRVDLRGIGPSIWRRLLVGTETAVAQLPEVLQIAFGCADSHLNRFEMVGVRLKEAKSILSGQQGQLVRQQLAEHLESHRACPCCHRPRTIKGCH